METFWIISIIICLFGLFITALVMHLQAINSWPRLLAKRKSGQFHLSLGHTGSWLGLNHVMVPSEIRNQHIYIVGASGSGKSSLLLNLLYQDISGGMGVIAIDPHGDLMHDTIALLGSRQDVTILDLADMEHVTGYNPLARQDGVLVEEQVAKVLLAFKRIWADSWGARMEDIMRHTLTLLIEQNYTLCEFSKILIDADFREMLVSRSEIHTTQDYFQNRFSRWSSKEREIYIESSLNKISALVSDPRLGARLGQTKDCISIANIIARGGILLVNLAKGRLGMNGDLLGALIMAEVEMSFLARPRGERFPYAVYIDEFQNIATESFETVLAEARKFGMCLTLVHQSLEQLEPRLISLILGNVRSQIYFRVGREDAEKLAREANNIVKLIADNIARSRRENQGQSNPPRDPTLIELWELAYQHLTRLPSRHAHVTIRGLFDDPRLLRTMDNPIGSLSAFPYGDNGLSLDSRLATLATRIEKINEDIMEFISK